MKKVVNSAFSLLQVLHSEMRKTRRDFGLADAYVLAVARRIKSKIMTGDLHFKGVKEAILI